MTELPATYLTHTTGGRPALIVPEPPAALDPRTRAFIVILARALQMVVNGLQELAAEPKR